MGESAARRPSAGCRGEFAPAVDHVVDVTLRRVQASRWHVSRPRQCVWRRIRPRREVCVDT